MLLVVNLVHMVDSRFVCLQLVIYMMVHLQSFTSSTCGVGGRWCNGGSV